MRIERVIHPGWLTILVGDESEKVWAVTHHCVTCGHDVPGDSFPNGLHQHTEEKHPSELFHLEMHQFRAALHGLDLFFGLEALEWPDRLPREFFPLLRKECAEVLP